MTYRHPLRKIITRAWGNLIQQDYKKARINSERSLQAAMWSRLNKALPRKTRRLFIEPHLVVRGGPPGKCLPDIVICNTHSVIGIIELKYKPHVKANWQKDLRSLQWIAKNKGEISLSNERYRGETAVRKYKFATDILYCWAAISRPLNVDWNEQVDEEFRQMFLPLHYDT